MSQNALIQSHLAISKKEFSICYTVDGVNVPNKSLAISFDNGRLSFSDTFGLYSVYGLGIFSREEVKSFAFGLAREYADVFFAGSEVKPDWSHVRSDGGLLIISGQQHNTVLNNMFLGAGVGTSYSVKQDATVLYPFWQCTFRFSDSVGGIDGVQVGVWGDTGEVAYCYEAGRLGFAPHQPDSFSSSWSVFSDDDLLIFAVVALIVLVVLLVVDVVVKKKRKSFSFVSHR